jgi:hypothetical protein
VVSLEPRIVVLHEFITNSEADEIIKHSAPRLRRSEVIGKHNDTLDDNRVSEQTWSVVSFVFILILMNFKFPNVFVDNYLQSKKDLFASFKTKQFVSDLVIVVSIQPLQYAIF